MPSPNRSGPRTGRGPEAAKSITGGTGRRSHSTSQPRPERERFVPGHPWTVAEIQTAIAAAICPQLVQALDRSVGLKDRACDCPNCGRLRSAYALGPRHFRCDACDTLGSWLALRQSVAMSIEACVRLAAIVHGRGSDAA